MRNAERVALVALALLLSPLLLRAQPPGVRADAVPDRTAVTLSQTVRVTLTLEGPAPLLVKLPEQLLTADANVAWRIRPDPPAGKAAVRAIANGREEWRQVFRLDPFDEGALLVSFNPVAVNGQPVTWPPVAIAVTKTVGEATPTAARPVTPPEDAPQPPAPPPRAPVPVWVIVAFGSACLAALVVVWARSRKAKPVPPGEWALAALAKLEAGGAETVERVAAILRAFVERRFAIPATQLTTAELSAAAGEQEWPVERAEPLRALLDECDRAKFAGDVPDDDGCRRLLRLAVDWVTAAP